MDIHHYGLFLGVTLLATISPGPAILLALYLNRP